MVPGSEERRYSWPSSHPIREVAALCGQRAGLSFVPALGRTDLNCLLDHTLCLPLAGPWWDLTHQATGWHGSEP